MTRNHVPAVNANGPNYLFESFAIFSELLLPDLLYRNETDPRCASNTFSNSFLWAKAR